MNVHELRCLRVIFTPDIVEELVVFVDDSDALLKLEVKFDKRVGLYLSEDFIESLENDRNVHVNNN